MKAFQIFNKTFKRDSLTTLYVEKISMISTSGVDGMSNKQFEKDLEYHINTIIRKVDNDSYHFALYKGKLISKGYKKPPRIVEKPIFRDRLVLRALYNILDEVYKDSLKNRGLHSQVKSLSKEIKNPEYDFLIRLDIKNFYPSIDHQLLIKEIMRTIKKKVLINLIKSAISTSNDYFVEDGIDNRDCGVPQGLSVANILANIFLKSFDEKYESNNQIKYYRYVDDILILCKEANSKELITEIVCDMDNMKLKLNEGDKYVFSKINTDLDYLGYRINNRYLSVRDESIQKYKVSIIHLLTTFKYKKEKNPKILIFRINLKITGCIWENKKYGWMFFFSKIEDENVLHAIDVFINRQLKRFGYSYLKPKNMVKTYYEITRNIFRTTYIPKYDLYSDTDILSLLEDMDIEYKNNVDARIKFMRLLKRETLSLERDMAQFS